MLRATEIIFARDIFSSPAAQKLVFRWSANPVDSRSPRPKPVGHSGFQSCRRSHDPVSTSEARPCFGGLQRRPGVRRLGKELSSPESPAAKHSTEAGNARW